MFGGAKPISFEIVGSAKDCWRIENETNDGRFSNPFFFLHDYIETFWRRQVSRQSKKENFFLFFFLCLEFSLISIWVCQHSERNELFTYCLPRPSWVMTVFLFTNENNIFGSTRIINRAIILKG